MVRKKNVLATMAQSLIATALVSLLWIGVAYSLAFSGEGAYIGDASRSLLAGIGLDTVSPFAKTIPPDSRNPRADECYSRARKRALHRES
jgi:Amt family ammonium transporter